MPETYFTSDLHFGHNKVIEFCERPWVDLEAMHVGLIERWNARVSERDRVFVLGDFSFATAAATAEIIKALNGYKVLIKGNHDRSLGSMITLGFNEAHDHAMHEGWFLCHYPLDPRSHIKQLNGHVHREWTRRGPQINVGVDVWDFQPRTLAELVYPEKGTRANA